MVTIVETHLSEQDRTEEIPGYKMIRRERNNKEKGGIIIYYKNALEYTLTLIPTTKELEENTVWLRLANSRIKIKIGVIYMPQESTTSKGELQDIYNKIASEIETSLTAGEKMLLVGDFNCKVGNIVPCNNVIVSKGEKMLTKMMTKYNLNLANATDKCIGVWTREERDSKSVLDYVILKQEDMTYLKAINIDEEKNECPYAFNTKKGSQNIMYSDHNVIEMEMDWMQLIKDHHQTAKKVVTKKRIHKI